jgi:thymidylate synthase
MRSSDTFLGLPFNIFSYTVLLYIIAMKCDMIPKDLVYFGGDVHIYKNHIDQAATQIHREPYPAPKLVLSDSIKHKDFSEMTIDDFQLIGYLFHPAIKAPMAV